MVKQKASAEILVADGVGGMRPVSDLRFEAGEWPITLKIPARDAAAWMQHVNGEVEDRGWSSSGLAQLDAAENSGNLSISIAAGPSPPSVDIVWDKPRGGDLRIRARPSGAPGLSLEDARNFIDAICARQRSGKTLRAHRQAVLTYDGLPWRGELWLNTDHRLGPPSKHCDFRFGPQAIILDAMVEGIGWQGVNSALQTLIRELRVFLSVVLGLNIGTSKLEFGWVLDVDGQGRITDCTLRTLGYAELTQAATQAPMMPSAGSTPPIPRRDVVRPGLGPMGMWPDMQEQWVPADIEKMWTTEVASLFWTGNWAEIGG